MKILTTPITLALSSNGGICSKTPIHISLRLNKEADSTACCCNSNSGLVVYFASDFSDVILFWDGSCTLSCHLGQRRRQIDGWDSYLMSIAKKIVSNIYKYFVGNNPLGPINVGSTFNSQRCHHNIWISWREGKIIDKYIYTPWMKRGKLLCQVLQDATYCLELRCLFIGNGPDCGGWADALGTGAFCSGGVL